MKLKTFVMPIQALCRGPAVTLRENGETVIGAPLIPATRTITPARGSRRAAVISKE